MLEAKRTSVPGLSRQEDPFPALEEDVMSLFSSSSLEPSESLRDAGECVLSGRQEPRFRALPDDPTAQFSRKRRAAYHVVSSGEVI